VYRLPAGWSQRFTCYTAALAGWLASRRTDWWRPLLTGGPFLGVRSISAPANAARWRFDHSPTPWVRALNLSVYGCDDWTQARVELDRHRARGSVIIAGDVYRLPWQRGHRRRHAPHWFVLSGYPEPSEVDDSLAMTTEDGPQEPYRGPVDDAALHGWARALPAGNPVHDLRELSVLGDAPAHLGRRYRWLAEEPQGAGRAIACGGETDGERLEGPDACHAIADDLAERGADPEAYLQSDDLWQAARQREFAAAAAAADPGLLSAAGLTHWCAALEVWRQIPALLLRARLAASEGRPDGARPVIAALRRAAVFEGRHLVTGGRRPVPAAEEWEQR
jgi:hypothetical protein